MASGLTAAGVLDRHFLEVRGRILELAAIFDRLDRGTGVENAQADPRLEQLKEGVKLLLSEGTGRAEKIQMLFSDEYLPNWKPAGK
ncbi:MAG: hypothetical protein KDA36_00285 [Planctomycetaceae bacterium]|nr:hypothetical protein [Planctomycetaceae bacterium]